MKLYFYHLSELPGEKPRIDVGEYEAESEEIAYQVSETFSMLLHDDGVVLGEKNLKKAAEIFKERFHKDIKRKQEKIDELKKEIENSYDLIDMIDDWRVENEAH